jgi:hypothetical protein
MNYKSLFQSATILLTLSGCFASIPHGTPTAMLRFTSGTPASISAACLKDRSLVFNGLVLSDYWSEVSPVKMLGTRSDKNNQVIERLIPADREMAFVVGGSIGQGDGYSVCSVTLSFAPKPAEQYQIHFSFRGEKCSAALFRLTENGGAIEKTPITPMYFNSQGDACK